MLRDHVETPTDIRLIFCGADDYWETGLVGDIRRRNLFFLRSFARDAKVRVYVLQRATLKSALARWRKPLRVRAGAAVPVRVVSWLPERVWLPFTARINRALARRRIRGRTGCADSSTVVWCYGVKGISMADDLDLEGRWFVDTDHDVVRDPNQQSMSPEELEALLLRGARRASRVFSASRSMLSWLRDHGVDHSTRLRNGVCLHRFAAPELPPGPRPGRSPVLGYVGVLSPWVDYSLLAELARRRPEWRFVLAGPWYRMSPDEALESLDNVEMRGYVPSHEVPRLLRSFDVGLGLYRREPWLDVDSMKLFEYLAAGLPPVSTACHPYLEDDFEGLVASAGNVDAFEDKVVDILAWREARRREWRSRCRDFLSRNTWERRAREALDGIREGVGRPEGGSR